MAIKTCELELTGCLQTDNLRTYAGMIVCQSCYTLEQSALKKTQSPEAVAERHAASTLERAQQVDYSIQVRSDIFNAETVSLHAIKEAIDTDDTITNKPYVMAEKVMERYKHYKDVVFELQQQAVEAGERQQATLRYLNNFANQLRVEEREKLKIQDISYQPKSPTIKVAKIRNNASKMASTKEISVAVAEFNKELGVSIFQPFQIKTMMLQKGATLSQVINDLRKSINEAKSMTPSDVK